MVHWVQEFLHYAHSPKIWGLHNYFDLNRGGDLRTSELLKLVSGEIWFTETGGLVWRYEHLHRSYIVRGEAYAERAAIHLFSLAAISPRIRRIYYYQWRVPKTLSWVRKHGKITWDSGLINPNCSLRPAFGIVARVLGRNPSRTPRTHRNSEDNCV
jgi:hypothetical protein